MAEISITQTDVENVFGAVFVAQWSSFDQGTAPTPDAARITLACNNAKNQVNARVATGPYSTPLSSGTTVYEIVNAMAVCAGYWLFKTRGLNYAKDTLTWMEDQYKEVNKLLENIRMGKYPIDCAYNTDRRQTPMVV